MVMRAASCDTSSFTVSRWQSLWESSSCFRPTSLRSRNSWSPDSTSSLQDSNLPSFHQCSFSPFHQSINPTIHSLLYPAFLSNRCTFAHHRDVGTGIVPFAGFATETDLVLTGIQHGNFSFRFDFHLLFSVGPIDLAVRWRIEFQIAAGFELDREKQSLSAQGDGRTAQSEFRERKGFDWTEVAGHRLARRKI